MTDGGLPPPDGVKKQMKGYKFPIPFLEDALVYKCSVFLFQPLDGWIFAEFVSAQKCLLSRGSLFVVSPSPFIKTIEVPNDNRRALSNGEGSSKPGSLTYPLAKISFFYFFPNFSVLQGLQRIIILKNWFYILSLQTRIIYG